MDRRFFPFWAVGAAVLFTMCLVASLHAAPLLSAGEPDARGSIPLRVRSDDKFAVGLLEVLEPGTGRVLKVVHAGSFVRERDFTLAADAAPGAIPAGPYRVRYREGLSLAVDGRLDPPAGLPPWKNPVMAVFRPAATYVLDAPLPGPPDPPELTERSWVKKDGERVIGRFISADAESVLLDLRGPGRGRLKLAELSDDDRGRVPPLVKLRDEISKQRAEANAARIYKLTPDGRADAGFGEAGRLSVGYDHAAEVRSFAVDEDGRIYLSSSYHEIFVFDAQGKRLPLTVGGWDNNPGGPRGLGWANTVLLGPDRRIYIPTAYDNLKVYDRSKPRFEGVLFRVPNKYGLGLSPCLATDGRGTVYQIGAEGVILRYRDTGTDFKLEHATVPPVKLAAPTGACVSAGLLWMADHGPSPGPYWDSGGGGEVLLWWDDGKSCRLVSRFGQPGTAADRPEFMDPSSVVAAPDHLSLWVVEDGHAYAEGPPGNARVRRFRLQAARTAEVAVELPRPPGP